MCSQVGKAGAAHLRIHFALDKEGTDRTAAGMLLHRPRSPSHIDHLASEFDLTLIKLPAWLM